MRLPRRIRVLVLASPVFFLLSCSDDPAAPEVPVQLDNELEALLATPPASNSADRAGDRAGTLDHLTRFALQKLAEARDREVVQ